MKNQSDDTLITLFQQGDNSAFDALLNRYKERLYTYIFLCVQNREIAEDVFQDTFMKAIVNIKSNHYNEKGRFLGYLLRISRNLIIDYFRDEQNSQFISPTDVGYDIFNDKDLCESSVEERLSDSQIVQDIRKLIRFLPQPQQEIVMMRFYKGMSFKEIAEAKNISINTALGRVRYAILNMRRMANEHHISLVS